MQKKPTTEYYKDIAEAVGVTAKYVEMVVEGQRGVRMNPLQEKIIQAYNLKMQQVEEAEALESNQKKELHEFCNSIKIEKVIPQ
jgi:hypothetical protein